MGWDRKLFGDFGCVGPEDVIQYYLIDIDSIFRFIDWRVDMGREQNTTGEILLYNHGGEKEFVSVIFQDETFWLTQSDMAELFDCTPENVLQHLKKIYVKEELTPKATAKKFLVVRKEGVRSVRRQIEHYNLDAIIAVGCRVNSRKATRFRQWATKTLKEYIQKGHISREDTDDISKFDRQTVRYLKGETND